MAPSGRSLMDRHPVASLSATTDGFTRTRQESLAASRMGTAWTLANPLLVPASGTDRLSNHDVPDTGVRGVDDGESGSTVPPAGTRGSRQEQQG